MHFIYFRKIEQKVCTLGYLGVSILKEHHLHSNNVSSIVCLFSLLPSFFLSVFVPTYSSYIAKNEFLVTLINSPRLFSLLLFWYSL